MKKQIIFSIFVLLFLTTISAFSPISPANVSLDCGNYKSLIISGVESNESNIANTIFAHPLKTGVDVAFDFKHITDGGKKLEVYIFTNSQYCTPGSTYTLFNIGYITYRINIEVLKEEYKLGEKLISINEALKIGQDIGQDISFGVLGVSEGSVHYILKGCTSISEEDTMTDEISMTCNGNVNLRIKILTTIPELGVAKFEVFSSEPGFVLTKSNQTIDSGDSSGCVLGLSNENTIISRGKLLTFTTINIIDNKPMPNIVVTIIDPGAEVADYSAKSNYIGFFSHKISEEFKEDHLIVQLVDMDGDCDALPLGRYDFDKSYDDYLTAKGEEEGAINLVLNMSERYEMKAISGTIKNELNEVIEGVNVKITLPDNSIITVLSNTLGLFTFTPTIVGNYSIQGGKDNFESTALVNFEVYQNKQYLVVIKVNGEQSSDSTYKKGQKLSFELRNENNTLIPLTINNATFAGLPLRFISGISDQVIFEDSCTLVVPSINGYKSQTISLSKKINNWTTWLYWIGIIFGIIILFFIIGLIIRKAKGGSKQNKGMEIQLGEAD